MFEGKEAAKVLVAEGEPEAARELAAAVSALGYDVVGIAGSAEEAIALAARTGPRAVLMDVAIGGGIDGIEAAKAIRQRDPVPILYAVECLRIISAGFFFYAYGMVLTQAFNGAGDTWTPTWLNVICFWLFEIPLAWLLARTFGLGPTGVFVAVTLAFSSVAALSALLFRRGRWKASVV